MSSSDPKLFVTQLFMLIKTAQIHKPGNRAFQVPFDQFLTLLQRLFSEQGAITLETIELSLYFNETKMRSDISTFGIARFLEEAFANLEIGGFRITKVPSAEETFAFLKLFGSTEEQPKGHEQISQLFAGKNFDAIEFLPKTEKRSVSSKEQTGSGDTKRRALKNYVKAIDVFRNVASGKTANQSTEARKAKRIVYDLVDICLEEGFSFFGLSSIKNYDEYTFNHSVNVCVIAIGFGKNLGLSKRQLGELGIAALYHDYGKTLIPLNILNKPGKFDAEEWEVMKGHPLMSIKKLLEMKGGFQPTDIKKMIAAFEHHRNYDCTGYPQTGVFKKPNFISRVVAIADAYDAMTTNRVYQRGMLPTVALKILMDNAGTKFDPLLTKAFVNTIGVYPVGSLLKFTTGTVGMVTAVHKEIDKMAQPIVRLVTHADGTIIDDCVEIDLSSNSEQAKSLVIDTVVHPEDYNINVAHFLFGDAVTP
jgi:HD-GYP domain-containing protein (c-di-GMP phosphodiesterase class II)